ncbi:MAG: class I SAM-dependent methyltransferase [Planctomycetota bacterium]|jgi:SAM-dependent methyltransferase
MDIEKYNREAWDREVEGGNPWTRPVGPEDVAKARDGEWGLQLTCTKKVPREWFGEVRGRDVLCLASGGGQQGPILAAAGAEVTVLDNSPKQLAQDRAVAEREGLAIQLEQGPMADLSRFEDGSFDLIFHPVSNVFAAEVLSVWEECYRVLRPGGSLLAGFANPVMYLFDEEELESGFPLMRYSIPYSDLADKPEDKLRKYLDEGKPLEYGHSLEDQIGGQIEAGFSISGFYEDIDAESEIAKFTASYLATKADKPQA